MSIRKILASATLVLASFTTAFTVGTVTAMPAAASVAAVSHTRLWWDGATCRAFAAGRFHAAVVDSRRADWYLEADMHLLAHDMHRHASARTLDLDRGYVGLDCDGSYGL